MRKNIVFILSGLIIIVIMTIYAVRLINWQLVNADSYQQASAGYSTFVKLEASRGEILDRNGVELVSTTTVYNVVMNALEIDSDRNIALEKLINLMYDNSISWTNILPIEIDETGKYVYKENSESEISYLTGTTLSVDENTTAEECMALLIEKYNCEDYSKQMSLDIISIRYNMTKTNFNVSSPYVITENVDINFVQIVEENSSLMSGIEIQVGTIRTYDDGTLAPHIVGTMGSITSAQYSSYSELDNIYSSSNVSGYSLSDKVGQSGIELAFEDVLRGTNGKQLIETDENGSSYLGEITEVPESGNSVVLTIDAQMQEILNYSLEKYINSATTEDAACGAAVVLDVETFGVLAASTYPSYDLDLYTSDTSYYLSLLEDENTPLFNRAFNGSYAPGSVMKPLVAIAALEEGVITTETTIYCGGIYSYYSDYPLNCIGSHSTGYVDLFLAMSSSCNSFFCDAGRLLGIEAMEVYANLFGLGEKTGIELSETSGSMTNPSDYEDNHGTSWVDGITIQAAIGQADNGFSPLQLATYVATIANDGVRLETHLLHQIVDFETGEIIEEYEPEIAETTDVSSQTIETVQEAMLLVTTTGTASDVFGNYGIEIAAKTGTAQNSGNSDTVSFIAYAPYDDPEIAVAITLEYAGSTKLAKYIAKDIFDYYFYDLSIDDIYVEELE
ncbi:MAG: penicillin-binding transpeptidase domain-containing protein [Clostridia bacterium]